MSTGHNVKALADGMTVVHTLTELSAKFGYKSTQKFRESILEAGVIPYQRISRERFRVRVIDLPINDLLRK